MNPRFLFALLLVACNPQEELNKAAAAQVADIDAKVAADAAAQYDIVKRNAGSPMERCSQAGMVTAAYLQAKDDANYAKWNAVQKADCKEAGMPE